MPPRRLITIDGTTKHLARWCREYSIDAPTVSHRIALGWDPVEAVTTPARRHHWLPSEAIGNIAYSQWQSVIQRCYDPSCKHFHRYGGRGIRMHASWRESYERFATDLTREIGPRPDDHQLDRVDNDRGYEPGNVRWATPKENSNNRTNNIRVTRDGETLTVSQWADRVGIAPAEVIARRVGLGWSVEDAVTKPVQGPPVELEIDGESMPIAEWAKRTGRNKSTIAARVRAGMPPRDAVFGELSRRFDGMCSHCGQQPRVDTSLCAQCRRRYQAEWRARRKADGYRPT